MYLEKSKRLIIWDGENICWYMRMHKAEIHHFFFVKDYTRLD
jgi:hypothetical protein